MYKFSVALAAGFLITTQVSAATLSLDETLGTFGIVTQSFSGNSESEGRVFVQGNATGTLNVNDRVIGDNGDGFDDLIITGDVTNASVKVGQSGNLTIGGDLANSSLQLNGAVQTATLGGVRSGGNFNQNEDILIENAANLNIPDVDFADYAAESAALAGQGGTAVSINAGGQAVFGGSAVILTSFAQLMSGTAVFDNPIGSTLVINVAGNVGTFGLNFSGFNGISALEAAESVVWNFFEATDISLNSSLFGHIVAPLAEITFNGSNEGNVIARSVIVNNGEAHPLAYTGNVSPEPEVSPVPLPAGIVMLLSGLGLLGAARLRRQA